ncbi:type VII secretion protein EccB [Corynebacterium confusum]|uniref:type VII secretion protein EccB n=1 Tax=uncultured Corynebacterium sp. TaxID=159447 RepID=UPI0025E76E33|nr:type VII secretion protein EccB [uncultured Corynebacterium sp.]
MARPVPTTKAQISGHKFLRRRVEHGLVMGDIRMIHDPLSTRRRALVFGLIAVVLVGIGSALLAWLQPEPNPGEAPIVESADKQLFVLVDGTYHPVANLASARIIVGEPAEPARIGTRHLDDARLGVPLGIADAPGFIAASGTENAVEWLACFAGADAAQTPGFVITIDAAREFSAGDIVVTANQGHTLLDGQAAWVETEDTDWLVDAHGRREIPPAETTEGRIIRRALGVDADTFRWELPAELLNAFRVLPAVEFPDPLPAVIDAGTGDQGLWGRADEGVFALTEPQADALVDAGADLQRLSHEEVAALPDAPAAQEAFHLPEAAPEFIDPAHGWLCATAAGRGAAAPPQEGTIELSGSAVADRFNGLPQGGLGLSSEHGFHLVTAHGLRHSVEDAATLEALGTGTGGEAPWQILRLLPGGSQLSREEALKASY